MGTSSLRSTLRPCPSLLAVALLTIAAPAQDTSEVLWAKSDSN
ncbi:MAG: hypothetical protein NZ481_02045 [Candidatus Kapabacteria bacterium]|nr:hypothetical protein [Candidatus Kapabacteria bacterium]